ncbi:MAG: DUF3794 domain-containing protein [Clostridiales bacterium]|nr:DUF3794 domain-containing protein [Clostridiales bacterium]
MDISLQKENFGFSSVIYDRVIEQNVTTELNLPDYMPDILRVIRATLTPSIISANLVGDRITVDGTYEAQIIYCCEEGELHSYCGVSDFSRYAECHDAISTDVVTVKAVCDYANCRALSPKKAEIKGNISIPVRLIRRQSQEVLTGAEGAGIQLKGDNLSAVSITAVGERTFSMSDVFELPDSRDSIKSVLYADAFAVIGEVKQISNKLMLRGELFVDVAYIPESSVSTIEHISHSLPISQIIELEGINENSLCEIHLSVPLIEAFAKPKADNTQRVVDISASVAVFVVSSEPKESELVLDAYSTTNTVDIKMNTHSLLDFGETIDEVLIIPESIDVSQNGVTSVTDIRIENPNYSTTVTETEFITSGTVKACIIYTDSANSQNYMEKLIDIKSVLPNNTGKSARFEPRLTVTGSSFVLSAAEKIDIKVEAVMKGNVYLEKTVTSVSDITDLGEKEKSQKARGVTVYFTDDNESLWDIARRYSTTIEAIAEENDISHEALTEKQMLIIPSI